MASQENNEKFGDVSLGEKEFRTKKKHRRFNVW
jgi:hypothetical protein